MATFVLVPGAWLGGWAWSRVTGPLRAAGHAAYPVTLTGLGERAHLASPQVDLETHLTDVVNLIEYEGLDDVVLVGHSYAGVVVTGVADRVPGRLAQVVYVDGGPVADGDAYLDMLAPEARAQQEKTVAERGDGWRLPMPSWEELEKVAGASPAGLGERERDLIRSRAVAQPFGTYTQPLQLRDPAREELPRALISCSFPLAQVRELIAAGHPWFVDLAGPRWTLHELPTGHWPLLSRPDDLAHLLGEVVPDRLRA
ncbi:MAG TPA: alpha/beta hydrolase [Actinomycetes bacterium]